MGDRNIFHFSSLVKEQRFLSFNSCIRRAVKLTKDKYEAAEI